MVESCSGLQGSLSALQWYGAPGPLRNPGDGAESVNGYWSAASNRIVLDLNDTINGEVVRHEMLHALIRKRGHPRSAFLESCGGVVACRADCVRDAGPAPTPDASIPRVTPAELEVRSEVSPSRPSISINGGLSMFKVSARNPFPHPVVVSLPSRPGGGLRRTFGYHIRQIGGTGVSSEESEFDSAVTFFKAGETKRYVFDFLVFEPTGSTPSRISGLGENGIALPFGTYSFSGNFGGQPAPDITVLLDR